MRRLLLWSAVLTLILAVGCSGEAVAAAEPSAEAVPPKTPIPMLTNLFYEPELFAAGNAAPAPYSIDGHLRGGMIPHHLLASEMIAGFFKLAAEQQPPYDSVIIVSPSHFPENCGSDAVTAMADWNTHLGTIRADRPVIKAILADKILCGENNPYAVERDHGVAGLTPYLRKYLPDLPLAVCLLSNKLSLERLTAFQNLLAEQVKDKNILVIASADCSHYLMPKEAAVRDEETLAAILSDNRKALLSYSDRNIDSPQSVTCFLRAAEAVDSEVVLLGHSSSDKKLPHAITSSIYAEGTTTYMVFAAVEADEL